MLRPQQIFAFVVCFWTFFSEIFSGARLAWKPTRVRISGHDSFHNRTMQLWILYTAQDFLLLIMSVLSVFFASISQHLSGLLINTVIAGREKLAITKLKTKKYTPSPRYRFYVSMVEPSIKAESHTGTQMNVPDSKIKHKWIFLCLHFPVESYHILFLSSMLDFVPCDLQLQVLLF